MSTGGNTTGEVLPELSVLVADVTPLRGAVRKQEVTAWIIFILFFCASHPGNPPALRFYSDFICFPSH